MVAAFAWYSRDLPDPDKLLERAVAQSTQVYDRTGETLLYEFHGDQRRTIVNLEDIPKNLINATVSVEDKNFYNHKGFSLTGIVRALIKDIFTGSLGQGGSTITQQFIKNAILTNEKRISRKMKELVLAYQLERKFSKDQILKLYFNEIPYGSNAYGVESAAQIYFGKSVRDLDLGESAILAALPQAPSRYSPFGSHVDELLSRQKFILDLMVEQGYITKGESEAAKAKEIVFATKRQSIIAPHFVFFVKEQLAEKYGELALDTGGMKIITTLDINKQTIAEEAVTNGMAAIEKRGGSNAALVALDSKTGEILAMVGSRDYFDTAHDGNVNVVIRPRQPGSSFKPIVYATAFKRGYTPDTMLFDLKTNFGGNPPYIPNNYSGGNYGPLSMRKALAGSLNIPAVQTLYLAGVNNVIDQAKQMGYTTLEDPDRYGLSLALGGGEVKLLEHTSAFATLAREGQRHAPAAVLRVEDKDGKVLEEFKPSEEEVLDVEVARQINSILSDNAARSFIFGGRNFLTLGDRPVAAKTGTTNDFRDAWTMGYTPSLTVGVWTGNNDNTSMKNGADGSVIAAPIWNEFMRRNLTGTPVETFKPPKTIDVDKPILKGQIDTVHTFLVDRVTGKLIPEKCRDEYPSTYTETRTFKETHTILHYVRKEDPRGSPPDDPTKDPQYASWEGAVKGWAAKQSGYINSINDLKYEDCDLRDDAEVRVTITDPANNATISGDRLTATVDIESTRPVKQVQYFLDNQMIQQVNESPYSLEADISDLTNGFYTLRAKVFDSLETIGQSSITINVLRSTSIESLYFLSPLNGATIDAATWPLTVSAFAYDPVGVTKVDVVLKDAAGASSILGSASNPNSTSILIPWPTAPATGTYRLRLDIRDNNGSTTRSDEIVITVTDNQAPD